MQSTIGRDRGSLLLIEEVLDIKFPLMLVILRIVGAGINIHVFSGVLNGLIRANREGFGNYMDFKVTRSRVRSLYQRKLTQLKAYISTSNTILYAYPKLSKILQLLTIWLIYRDII